MELSEFKRVKVNGEAKKVVQTGVNKPRFRSNGYQLELNESNDDNGRILGKQYVIQNGSKIVIYWTPTGLDNEEYRGILDTQFVGSAAGTFLIDSRLTFNGVINVEIRNNAGTAKAPGQILSGSFIPGVTTKITFEVVNNETVITTENSVNGLQSWTSSYGVDWGTCTVNSDFFIGKRQTAYSNGVISYLEINGEIFDFGNINELGQVISSEGATLQFNTSAAGGNDYVLGTMFHKSSFSLGFDSANSEYIYVNQDLSSITNLSLLNFKVKYSTQDNSKTQQVFSILANGGGGWVSLEQGSTGILFFIVRDNTSTQRFTANLGARTVNKVYDIEFNGSQLLIDGVVKYTVTSPETIDLNFAGVNIELNSWSNSRYGDQTYFGFSLDGTNYPLTEGLGNTTNGAEIITSAADSNERINFGMWQKNGNVLKLDSSNDDYLQFPFVALSKFSDLSFEVKGVFTHNGTSQQIFSYGSPSANTGSYSLFITNTGQIYFQCYDTNSSLFVNQLIETISGTVEKTYTFDGLFFYIDGVNTFDFSSSSNIVMNPSIANLPRVGQYYVNTRALSGKIISAKLDSKTFLFREGKGEITASEDGTTTAEIKTSAAGSEDYIDAEIWQEEITKQIDYKKQ